MGVAVDKAGGDDQPVGVDHPFGRGADAADLDDGAVRDADIGAITRQPGSVHHGAVFDQQVETHGISPIMTARLSRDRGRFVNLGHPRFGHAGNALDPNNPEDSRNPEDPFNPGGSRNPEDPFNPGGSCNPEDPFNPGGSCNPGRRHPRHARGGAGIALKTLAA
jgi:hypothetical protein